MNRKGDSKTEKRACIVPYATDCQIIRDKTCKETATDVQVPCARRLVQDSCIDCVIGKSSMLRDGRRLDKKAVLSQGNRAMPQLFFSV